jgi:hypothetical protein
MRLGRFRGSVEDWAAPKRSPGTGLSPDARAPDRFRLAHVSQTNKRFGDELIVRALEDEDPPHRRGPEAAQEVKAHQADLHRDVQALEGVAPS